VGGPAIWCAHLRILTELNAFDNPSALGYCMDMAIQPKCRIHGVPLVCFCPACRGSARSPRKARTSRRNGKFGGRPPKEGKRDAN
jgi:hypothetical protein